MKRWNILQHNIIFYKQYLVILSYQTFSNKIHMQIKITINFFIYQNFFTFFALHQIFYAGCYWIYPF